MQLSEINWDDVLKKVDDPRLISIPAEKVIPPEKLEELWPEGNIYTCDAYVGGSEKGHEVVGGYQLGRIINIDHHAPTSAMSRIVSSTPLAIERVRQCGIVGSNDCVVINHHDCDSVLSSCIMLGILPALDLFGEAAIAADHTGDENEIADLLQALDDTHDVAFSLRNLANMVQGRALEPEAERFYHQQKLDKVKARQIVEEGRFKTLPGGVVWAEVDSVIDGQYFVVQLPKAKVILLVGPHEKATKKRIAIRLGAAAPEGFTLFQLGISSIDPNFGSRWNAGSNNRGGGTDLPPQEYAQKLDALVAQHLR